MDRIHIIYGFIKEFWQIIKKYINVPPNHDNDSWDRITDEATALIKKYRDGSVEGEFFKRLVFDWLDYLHDRNKEAMNDK